MHGILIYEIVRHIEEYTDESVNVKPDLSCIFPSGTGFITVKSIWGEHSIVQKFKLDPKTSIEVSVPLIWENNTYVFELL